MKWMIMILLVSIFALGCELSVDLDTDDTSTQTQENSANTVADNDETQQNDLNAEEQSLICTTSSDCTLRKYCVDGECKTIKELYQETECEEKCKFSKATILTNDGDTLTFPPGKGSYIAGGGIEWKIASGSEYCKGNALVPIKVLMRSGGKAIHEEMVALKVGEKSKDLIHPNSEDYKLTLSVESVEEVCE
jgi:hypothetical protein